MLPLVKKSGFGFWRSKGAAVGLVCLLAGAAQAQNSLFTNLLAHGEVCELQTNVQAALKFYQAAEAAAATNAPGLCVLTKHYCDLMRDTPSANVQKTLAQAALACATRAVKADPKNATAHICLAIGYAKNFPDVDIHTKVIYSRAIKSECEKAIALDPNQDLAFYLLGRWNFGVAHMNIFEKGFVKVIYGGLPEASDAAAIEDFKRAIALSPDRILSHAELAKVYKAAGDKKLAQTEWKKCCGLKPLDRDDQAAQQQSAEELNLMCR